MSGLREGKTEFRIQNETSSWVAYELIPMYTPGRLTRSLGGNAGLEPAQHDSTFSSIPSFSQAPETLVEDRIKLSKRTEEDPPIALSPLLPSFLWRNLVC